MHNVVNNVSTVISISVVRTVAVARRLKEKNEE